MTVDKPLAGWRVLVPRGGAWGDGVSANLREYGASPVVAPLVNFASAEDPDDLADALRELREGAFDWVVVTSGVTVDVFVSQNVVIPEGTKVAAVGDVTASVMRRAGYRMDFVPQHDNSARGLVAEWPEEVRGRVLIPQSELAEPTLVTGLSQLGYDIRFVTAYRLVGVPLVPAVARDLENGGIHAVLVTSGSIARELNRQIPDLPTDTVLACIGPRTALDTRALGLSVEVIADERSATSLNRALAEYAAEHPIVDGVPLVDGAADAATADS